MITWTKQQARDFFVNYQMINTSETFTIEDVFNRIKTIQMDPLNVVGTNPELVLQSRIKGFKKIDLQNALYKDRILIDGWEKQMSIYETKYFPYFHYVRDSRSAGSMRGALKYRNIDINDYIEDVHTIIKEKGPIFSSEIKIGESQKSSWGQNKPSTLTIDYLWHKGILGITERKNTQKKYDLLEKLYPEQSLEPFFTNEEDFTSILEIRRREVSTLPVS